MAGALLVLPSPLLPERAYEPLVGALRRRGADAAIAPAGLADGEDAGSLVRRWSDLAGPRTVLVPHSNAGYLAPSVRARAAAVPIVFVDAALPPAAGNTTLVPPGMRSFLADLADEHGVLPPWTRWWPRADLDAVLPADRFADLDGACPQLPLGYFDFRLAVPADWASGPNAYLAFGDTYAIERELAAATGWPHATLRGRHLHFLHEPEAVAEELLALARNAVSEHGDGHGAGLPDGRAP